MKRGPFVWCVFVDYDRLGSKWWSGVMAIKTVSQTVRMVFVRLGSSLQCSAVSHSLRDSVCLLCAAHQNHSIDSLYILYGGLSSQESEVLSAHESRSAGISYRKKDNLFYKKTEFSASLISHDPSEIILMCWFAALKKKHFLWQLCAA